jgi:hypothetical protein
MLAFSKAPHIKLGWLWKLARHRNTFGMRNWKKRYITLNTKSRVLSYYKSKLDFEKTKTYAGNVILPKDASVRRSNQERDFCLEIWGTNGVKLLVLAAESEAEINVWYNTLLTVCEQLNKAPDRKSQNVRSSVLAAIGVGKNSRSSESSGRGSSRASMFLEGLGRQATKLFKNDSDSIQSTTPTKGKNDDEVSSELPVSTPSPSPATNFDSDYSRIIRVEECGSRTANGLYRAKYRTISCGAPVYVNSNGFTLQLENVTNSHLRRWYIKKGSLDYYECDDDEQRRLPLVPTDGWTACEHSGEIPPPKVVNNGRSGGGVNDTNSISSKEVRIRKLASVNALPPRYAMGDAEDPLDAETPNLVIFNLSEENKPSMDDFETIDEMLLHKLIASDLLDDSYRTDLPRFVYVKPIVVEEKTEDVTKMLEKEKVRPDGYLDISTVAEEDREESKTGVEKAHDSNDFAPPPPPPSFDVNNFAPPPPTYVSPRNKLKQTASFNIAPPKGYGDGEKNVQPPPTYGFYAPPPTFAPPLPTAVLDLPPPPPTSLPSFNNLPPPPQAEETLNRQKSKFVIPDEYISWDNTDEAKARRRSRSNIPSPPISNLSEDDDDISPPPLPKALSLSGMLGSDSPPPVPALPPTD